MHCRRPCLFSCGTRGIGAFGVGTGLVRGLAAKLALIVRLLHFSLAALFIPPQTSTIGHRPIRIIAPKTSDE